VEEDPFPEDEFEEEIDLDICAPRTKVIDGQIVIDQQSLLVPVNSNTPKEPMTRVVVSSSKRYNPAAYGRRGKIDRWGAEETEEFYQALRMTTDFSLIQKLFPNRTRTQIKNKYKKEERENPRQLDWCFKNPIPLDFQLFRTRGGITDEDLNASENTNPPPSTESQIKQDEATKLPIKTEPAKDRASKQDKLISQNTNNGPFEIDDEDDYNTPYDIDGIPLVDENDTTNTVLVKEEAHSEKPLEEDPFPEEDEEAETSKTTKSSVNSIEDAFSFF